MDLNKLKTFYMLAQVKNYSKCAEKCFVTQSAVSHSIKSLEESLGLVLVEKKRPGFRLTVEGEVLCKSCKKIFSELESVTKILKETKDYQEKIRLGAPVEFGNSIVVQGLQSFYQKYPNISVDLTLSDSLLKPLMEEDLDLIIDCKPHLSAELAIIPLFREEYVVIASPQYVKQRQINKVDDLEKCTIISMDEELLWWSNFIHALDLNSQNVTIKSITVINNIRGVITGAGCSMGVGFVPRYSVLKELEQKVVVELFPEMEMLKDNINIYIKQRNYSGEKFRKLIEHVRGFELQ